MKFKFKSRTDFDPDLAPPTVLKMIAACSKLADSELIDAAELASKIAASDDTVRDYGPRPEIRAHYHVIKHRGWFGNARTIAEAKKQFPR